MRNIPGPDLSQFYLTITASGREERKGKEKMKGKKIARKEVGVGRESKGGKEGNESVC